MEAFITGIYIGAPVGAIVGFFGAIWLLRFIDWLSGDKK